MDTNEEGDLIRLPNGQSVLVGEELLHLGRTLGIIAGECPDGAIVVQTATSRMIIPPHHAEWRHLDRWPLKDDDEFLS